MVASPVVISYSVSKMRLGERTFDHRLVIVCLGLTLAVSPTGQVFLPWGLGALPNFVVALAVIVLGVVGARYLRPLPARLNQLAGLSLALLLWGVVVSASSWFPLTSFRYWTKGVLYGAFFWAVLGVCTMKNHRQNIEMVLIAFLAALAAFGLVETAVPDLPLFSWLRVPHSLTIRPRIASVLSWPNTLGALMVMGVALTESLGVIGRITAPVATGLTSLFVLLTAQSGSRNAWTSLIVALALLALRKQVSLRRSLGIALLFGICVFFLPVPRFQMGVLDAAALPVSPQHAASGRAPTSLAEPLQSLSLRQMLWNRGLRAWEGRPFRGVGLGVFSTHLSPTLPGNTKNPNLHSLPLNVLVETGIPGLILVLAWLRTVMGGGLKSPAMVALMTALVAQLFDNFLYDPSFTLVFLTLCATVAATGIEATDASRGIEPDLVPEAA